jgi:predicted RNA binding protein YcfA (HicA-like mRNA interferase family)
MIFLPKLKTISGKKMCKLVEKIGFKKIHQKGSHTRYTHLDGRKTLVPVHGNEEIGIGLLIDILKQIDLTKEEYEKIRKKV